MYEVEHAFTSEKESAYSSSGGCRWWSISTRVAVVLACTVSVRRSSRPIWLKSMLKMMSASATKRARAPSLSSLKTPICAISLIHSRK